MTDPAVAEILSNYILRVEQSRIHESHPAVAALRKWYDESWHHGTPIHELDEDELIGEAAGSQRYPDIIPQLLKLPSNEIYEVYDGEATEPELARLLREEKGSFSFTSQWRGTSIKEYGAPKGEFNGRSVTYHDYPGPDLRSPYPDDLFTQSVGETVYLKGSPIRGGQFFGALIPAIQGQEAVQPEIDLEDDGEYTALTIMKNPATGKLALYCEMGGISGFTGGWTLMVYPKEVIE